MTAIAPARGTRLAPGPVQSGAAPERRPELRRSQHLRPVERPRPRRSPAVPALVAVGIVIVALLGLAVMHAVLIGGQVRLDAMRSGVASETEAIRRLELRVAELESPDRVLDAARDRLGMVQPTEVGYLLPVGVEGAADEPMRVAAAEEPPADDGLVVEGAAHTTTSPEQAEVDAALDGDGIAPRSIAPESEAEGGRDG